MANIKISELNSLSKKAYNDVVPIVDVSANETKKVSIEELVNNNVSLIAVDSVAPEECVEGDKYFNTTTNLIYTATGTDTWGTTGESPIEGIFYIVFEEQTTYAYNGTTLVSVGGGAGGGGDNEPIGKVVPMVLETAPDGYLLCDGSTYTKTQYPDLYKALRGTVYQLDDEEFQVPNIQGKVIVGKNASDTDFSFIGKNGGSKELQEHGHTVAESLGTAVRLDYGSGGTFNKVALKYGYGSSTADDAYITTDGAGTGNSGNLQPYIVLNYFIKAQKTSGDVVLSEDIKIGTIFQWSGSTAPTNYMICDGSAISRTNYADLFSIIGTTYGNGDGSTTFNLPDFRGNVAVGYKSGDSDFGTLGGTGGSKELQEHNHQQKGYRNILMGTGESVQVVSWRNTDDDAGGPYTKNTGTGNSGNLQPYQVVNYIIKVSGTTQLSAQVVNTYNTSDSDTYSCDYINNSESYSTSEVMTNKRWIDNRPIYRKVIETNLTTSETEKDYTLSSLGLDNISTLVDLYSVSQSEPKERDYYSSNTDQLRTLINPVNLVVLVGSSYPTRPCTIYTIIEYTKTTD